MPAGLGSLAAFIVGQHHLQGVAVLPEVLLDEAGFFAHGRLETAGS